MIVSYKITIGNLDIGYFFDEGGTPPAFNLINCSRIENNVSHCHINYEIHYIFDGTVAYSIGNKNYTASKNTLLVIPPREFHSLSFSSNLSRFIFEISISDNGTKNDATYQPFGDIFKEKLQKPFVCDANIPEFAEMFRLYHSQYDPSANFGQADLALLKSYGTIAFFKMMSVIKDHDFNDIDLITTPVLASLTCNVTKDIVHIISYITFNYNRNPSIEELAQVMHLSVRQTERIIRTELNSTFTQILNEYKVNQAMQMIYRNVLTSEACSLEEISETIGFNNYYTFLKQFKIHAKCSPTDYKKQCMQKLNFN